MTSSNANQLTLNATIYAVYRDRSSLNATYVVANVTSFRSLLLVILIFDYCSVDDPMMSATILNDDVILNVNVGFLIWNACDDVIVILNVICVILRLLLLLVNVNDVMLMMIFVFVVVVILIWIFFLND